MKNLPIEAFRADIISALNEFSVCIIQADTGAGKSTRVPAFLSEAGYNVIVTEPRRIAARSLAERVAEERGERLGETVGYMTAEDAVCPPPHKAKIVFCTDGLQLVREIMSPAGAFGTSTKANSVLVIDEVHEWNLNQEVLIAWVKSMQSQGIKAVIMSATIDAQALSNFFDGAPVISVPGRLFPVEKTVMRCDHNKQSLVIANQAVEMARKGRHVLVFQPGKREIEETIGNIEANIPEKGLVEVLPLHGELSSAEQRQVFSNPSKPRIIVATNIAQTSITIPYIDAVVDAGLQKTKLVSGGIEGLFLQAISKADAEQRAGRAGRVKPGVYVRVEAYDYPVESSFSTPEIERVHLDQAALKLLSQGYDIEKLPFFHPPKPEDVRATFALLEGLGAIDADRNVTSIGKKMARLPLRANYARMMVEAQARGAVREVATIVASLENGGFCRELRLLTLKLGSERAKFNGAPSDHLVHLLAYEWASSVKAPEGKSRADFLRENNIIPAVFFRTKELVGNILRAVKHKDNGKKPGNRDIILSVLSGYPDGVYKGSEYGCRNELCLGTDPRGRAFSLSNRSTVNPSAVSSGEGFAAIATPQTISGTNRRGSFQFTVLSNVTKVTYEDLKEVFPALEKEVGRNPFIKVLDNLSFRKQERRKTSILGIEKVTEVDVSAPSLQDDDVKNQLIRGYLVARIQDQLKAADRLRYAIESGVFNIPLSLETGWEKIAEERLEHAIANGYIKLVDGLFTVEGRDYSDRDYIAQIDSLLPTASSVHIPGLGDVQVNIKYDNEFYGPSAALVEDVEGLCQEFELSEEEVLEVLSIDKDTYDSSYHEIPSLLTVAGYALPGIIAPNWDRYYEGYGCN